MDAATVGATILPLVGVALGTAGTLIGQYLATRGESRRHADQRVAGARAERKEAIIAFLNAAQRVEQLNEARTRGRTADEATTDDVVHSLWLAKKVLELVCGHGAARQAHRYTAVLHELARSPSTEAAAARRNEYRAEFMEEARRELGITGPRLYRTAGGIGFAGPGSEPAPGPAPDQGTLPAGS